MANLFRTDIKIIKSYADRINAQWHKAAENIMQLAEVCCEVNDLLEADEKHELFEQLNFSAATFSKLIRIGNDNRLQKPKIKKILPPNFSVIYQITGLDDITFDEAVKTKVINPTLKRRELIEWVENKKKGSNNISRSDETYFLAEIRYKKTITQGDIEEIEAFLAPLTSVFDVDIKFASEARGREIGRLMNQRQKKVDAELRKAVKAFFRHFLLQRLGGRRKLFNVRNHYDLCEAAGYKQDAEELYIDKYTTRKKLMWVMRQIESEDHYSILLEKVEERVPLGDVKFTYNCQPGPAKVRLPKVNEEQGENARLENARIKKISKERFRALKI